MIRALRALVIAGVALAALAAATVGGFAAGVAHSRGAVREARAEVDRCRGNLDRAVVLVGECMFELTVAPGSYVVVPREEPLSWGDR